MRAEGWTGSEGAQSYGAHEAHRVQPDGPANIKS